MKTRKIFLLIISCLVITGCTVKYEIEIENNKVTEYSEYLFVKEKENETAFEYANNKLFEYFDNTDILYMKDFKNFDDKYGIFSSNTYSLNDYIDESKVLKNCYTAVNFNTNKKYITLKTTNEFLCYNMFNNLGNITFSIKSNHKVKEHNADVVKDNKYTWNITPENKNHKPIVYQAHLNKYVFDYHNNFMKNVIYIILIIAIISSVILIIYIFLRQRNKKANQI